MEMAGDIEGRKNGATNPIAHRISTKLSERQIAGGMAASEGMVFSAEFENFQIAPAIV